MHEPDVYEYFDGFYYYDESGDSIGPFKTAEQAQIAFDAYSKWMNHDHHKHGIPKKMRANYD